VVGGETFEHESAPTPRKPAPKISVREEVTNRNRQSVGVSRRNEQAGLAIEDGFRNAAHIRRHHSGLGELSLQDDKRKPFEPRGQDEHIERRQVRARILAPALPDDAPLDSEPTRDGLEAFALASIPDNGERRALDVAKGALRAGSTAMSGTPLWIVGSEPFASPRRTSTSRDVRSPTPT
jgi:hypothetical protein